VSLSLEAPNCCHNIQGESLARDRNCCHNIQSESLARDRNFCHNIQGESLTRDRNYCYNIQGESLARGPKLLSQYTERVSRWRSQTVVTIYRVSLSLEAETIVTIYRVSLSLEAPNYCHNIQSESLARGPKLLSQYTE